MHATILSTSSVSDTINSNKHSVSYTPNACRDTCRFYCYHLILRKTGKYKEIDKEFLSPNKKNQFCGSRVIIQQDNETHHTAGRATAATAHNYARNSSLYEGNARQTANVSSCSERCLKHLSIYSAFIKIYLKIALKCTGQDFAVSKLK